MLIGEKKLCGQFDAGCLRREKIAQEFLDRETPWIPSQQEVGKGVRIQCRSFAIEMEPGSPWALKPEAYGIELNRRTFGDYLQAHAPGATGELGYLVKNTGDDSYAENIQKEACKHMCPLPPSPRLGHLTCKALRIATTSPLSSG